MAERVGRRELAVGPDRDDNKTDLVLADPVTESDVAGAALQRGMNVSPCSVPPVENVYGLLASCDGLVRVLSPGLGRFSGSVKNVESAP